MMNTRWPNTLRRTKDFYVFLRFFFALLDVYDECRVKVSNISSSRETRKIIITCSSLYSFLIPRFRRIFRLVRLKDFPLLKIHVKDFSIRSAFTFGAMTSEMFRSVHFLSNSIWSVETCVLLNQLPREIHEFSCRFEHAHTFGDFFHNNRLDH